MTTFLKIIHSLVIFTIRKKDCILAPAMTFQIWSKRNSHRNYIDSPRVFVLRFPLSLVLWKKGGVGGTQSHSVFSLLLPKWVSEPLPSSSFPAPPSTPSPPTPISQMSSHPLNMCWPCAVKLPVPSTSAGWQQLGPISNQLQKPHCSSAPLHLELEIALEFPCTVKSRGWCRQFFTGKSYLVLNCFSIRLCTRVLSSVNTAYPHSRKESFILPASIET